MAITFVTVAKISSKKVKSSGGAWDLLISQHPLGSGTFSILAIHMLAILFCKFAKLNSLPICQFIF